jgi:hypothetical protein
LIHWKESIDVQSATTTPERWTAELRLLPVERQKRYTFQEVSSLRKTWGMQVAEADTRESNTTETAVATVDPLEEES